MISIFKSPLSFISAGAAMALMSALTVFPAWAEFPDHALKIIVPYPPGGTTDLLARAPRLSDRLKQSVIVENRAGAGGTIGAKIVAKSPPDGYTLVFGTIASHGILPVLMQPAPYDALKDFGCVALTIKQPARLCWVL